MKNVYIVGIGGAGTSALARLYKAQGYVVRGSDNGDSYYTKPLAAEGFTVFDTFDAAHVPADVDFAVHSTAFDDDNVEITALKARGVTVYTYPEALGKLTQESITIAVCGTHGKTTTTALTVHALVGAGRDPQAIVGARVVGWHGGARAGRGKELVIEADEYQNKLALYHPHIVILTSIDFDHPDFFPDAVAYTKVFADFVARVPRHGTLIACADDQDVVAVIAAATCRTVTYGEDAGADARIIARHQDTYGQRISIEYGGDTYEITTSLFGMHNARNALGAWLASVALTRDAAGSAAGIAACKGTARRFERKGLYKGAVLIDDYAHHPEEIRATLTAVREIYPRRRVIAAFHPHTFSRTVALLPAFAGALNLADVTLVLSIYGSAREEAGHVTSDDVVRVMKENNTHVEASSVTDIAALAAWASANLDQDDVFITLGAGDIWQVYDLLLNQ